MNAKDVTNLLSGTELFALLSDQERERLAEGVGAASFPKGSRIVAGQGCAGILFVRKGRLRVYLVSEKGRDITLYFIEPGEICVLSASCVISAIAFQVEIEAEEDTEAIRIAGDVYAALQKNNLRLENYTLRLTVDRFNDVMWSMQQLLFFNMDQRIATYLYDECGKRGTTELLATHESIARSIGSAREVVSRVLKQFARENIVVVGRGKITVLDERKLAEKIDQI